jgi:phage tail sheath protein FI
MAMKTPGVYIVEKNAFPNSVVEVATAVPAFIGYTQSADNRGKTLRNTPWRISSLAEYQQYFGGPPVAQFSLTEVPAPTSATSATGTTAATGTAGATGTAVAAAPAPTPSFKQGDKGYLLTQTGGRFLLYYGMLQFFQNGGGPCYIVSVGDYSGPVDPGDLTAGIDTLIKEQEPTMLVIPDAMLLKDWSTCITLQQAMLAHCGNVMRNRVSILDIYGGDKSRQENNCIENFRDNLGVNYLDFAAAYYPWVQTTIVEDRDVSYLMIAQNDTANSTDTLKALLKADMGLPGTAAGITDPKTKLQLQAITKDWAGAADAKLSPADKAAWVATNQRMLNNTLLAASPIFKTVLADIQAKLNLLPPSAAMAGVYTMVDNNRGVWKAPANVSLAGVVRPAVSISAEDQEDLNVTTQGKSINAIRAFVGEGVLVWGARTLDGNSLDWRYINVRRTMIMLEESCRLAAKAMVFEPNVANTWVTIKSMLQNFLTGIWKRGGLAGTVPEDAFSVHVGLGETMTPDDILEGILRVTVLVAVSRPAEFIEITFQQQMQKS